MAALAEDGLVVVGISGRWDEGFLVVRSWLVVARSGCWLGAAVGLAGFVGAAVGLPGSVSAVHWLWLLLLASVGLIQNLVVGLCRRSLVDLWKILRLRLLVVAAVLQRL